MTTAAAGVIVSMGGQEVRFLPLNWATLELLQDKLDLVSGMGTGPRSTIMFTAAERDAVLDVVYEAARASGNDITRDWVKENLNLGNVDKLLEAVFNTNGFVSANSGDANGAATGEAKAAGSVS